jgi:hypothetical protein
MKVLNSLTKQTLLAFLKRTNVFFAKMVDVLELLVKFFNADNQGLSKEILVNADIYKQVKKYCKLQTIETNKLLHLYYQELTTKQNSLKSGEYGSLYCRAFYHSKDSLLVVESNYVTIYLIFIVNFDV